MKPSRRSFLKNSTLGILGMTASPKTLQAAEGTQSGKPEKLPVFYETDICVIGGSCTGVFAAVRAARLGAKVAIIEKHNAFGGVATTGLVNIWHSLQNTEFNKEVIAGLTLEVLERLKRRDGVIKHEFNLNAWSLNPFELMMELDELVVEHNIRPFLHTLFSMPILEGTRVTGVVVENKSGRGIIKAKYFIDDTGDGDVLQRAGVKSYTPELLNPPTTCTIVENSEEMFEALHSIPDHLKEYSIPEGFIWGCEVPGTKSYMLAGSRVYGVNCCNADDLTKAEIEGRRQVRAMMDIIRKYNKGKKMALNGLASQIGIRETRHISCQYQLKQEDILNGKPFEDAIACGSYRADMHHQDKPGITFRYLDGTEVYSRPGAKDQKSRWREETAVNPTFYHIPMRSIMQNKLTNVMLAGRMLDADPVAFSAIRVMVNMNQTGEAAGVAVYLALNQSKSVQNVDVQNVRNELKKGGSIII